MPKTIGALLEPEGGAVVLRFVYLPKQNLSPRLLLLGCPKGNTYRGIKPKEKAVYGSRPVLLGSGEGQVGMALRSQAGPLTIASLQFNSSTRTYFRTGIRFS